MLSVFLLLFSFGLPCKFRQLVQIMELEDSTGQIWLFHHLQLLLVILIEEKSSYLMTPS